MWKWLEAFELGGEIGLRYVLVLLIIIGLLVSWQVITTGRPFDYGFMRGIMDSAFALIVLVGIIIITRELWFFRIVLQTMTSQHKKTVAHAEEILKSLEE
jgi:hypothetical protein